MFGGEGIPLGLGVNQDRIDQHKGRVQTCKLDTLESIAAALGYEVTLVKKAD